MKGQDIKLDLDDIKYAHSYLKKRPDDEINLAKITPHAFTKKLDELKADIESNYRGISPGGLTDLIDDLSFLVERLSPNTAKKLKTAIRKNRSRRNGNYKNIEISEAAYKALLKYQSKRGGTFSEIIINQLK